MHCTSMVLSHADTTASNAIARLWLLSPSLCCLLWYELTGALCFVLPGRIVRGLEQQATIGEKPSTAVEFTRLDELNRSQLLRWVYREQVRRHREDASV